MTERLCRECDGVVAAVPDGGVDGGSDLELMCVVCGAALSLGGLLLGELDAADPREAAVAV